ncbi:MAG: hypothetical protein ACRDIB_01075, partial [Ardenticatenaceae bacterium]
MSNHRAKRHLSTAALLVVLLILLGAYLQPLAAQGLGNPIHTTFFSEPCPSGVGVGIAFDGAHLWYSCHDSSPDLFKADPFTGEVVTSYN